MNDAVKKLKTLGMWHYVLAALCVPVAFVPPMMLLRAIGTAVPPEMVLAVRLSAFGGLAGSLVLIGCLAFAGRALRQQRHRTFCFVVGIFLCPAFPLGTILGISTLKTSNRSEVNELFSSSEEPDETL